MEVNILNIAQEVDERRLREALASILHGPPFRRKFSEPPINFDVYLHPNEGETRQTWDAHRGTASMTLPEYWQGKIFLRDYGESNGFMLMGQKLHFSQSERRPAEGLVESLRRLPWLDPKELARRNGLLQQLSRPIPIREIQFGRPCRDSVFSVEHKVDLSVNNGHLTFDPEYMLIRIAAQRRIMTFRPDTVTNIVADEKANAILVVLRTPPSFEEVARLHTNDKAAEGTSGAVEAARIPLQLPPVPGDIAALEQPALEQKPAPKQQAAPRQPAPRQNARALSKKTSKSSSASTRIIPGLTRPPAPVPKKKVDGWGNVVEPATPVPSTTIQFGACPVIKPTRAPHPNRELRDVVPGLPSLDTRPPLEQTAYARAVQPRLSEIDPSSPRPSLTASPKLPRHSSSSSSINSFSVDTSPTTPRSSTPLDLNGSVATEEADLPPSVDLGADTLEVIHERPKGKKPDGRNLRTRTSWFDENHKNTAAYTSRVFRLCFNQNDSILEFEENAEKSWTGFSASTRSSIKIAERHLYSVKNRSRIPAWLQLLPLGLGMQLQAIFLNGTLDPVELLTLEKPIAKYLETINPDNLAHAVMILSENIQQADAQAGVWGAKIDLVDMLEMAVARIRDATHIIPIHRYMVKIFHLYITPTSMILEGPYASETNRILRKYSAQNESMLRVTFCEESRREYRWERNIDWPEFLRSRVGKYLLDGVVLAGRSFRFLGYSMSSLRMRTAWFMTPFVLNCKEVSPESIRHNLGDFSKVVNAPARYGARIAQAFTATRPSLRLRPEQILREDDITDENGHCFTDGAARISLQLAREVLKAVGDAFGPSPSDDSFAFQFRLGGAKGVAAIDTNMEGSYLALRPSNEKFDAPDSLDFEVVLVIWECRPLTLNQDIIQILEDRGVDADIFLDLQSRALAEARGKRASVGDSAGLLLANSLGEAFDVPVLLQRLARLMPNTEIEQFAEECEGGGTFLQHCIRNAFVDICRNLKYKARLPVPGGYIVVGTADETRSLKEREIYCCVTPFGGFPRYFKGPVLVFRSPAVHPGDAQVLHAIGEPPEEHKAFFDARRNQIVFSVRGVRPLASELGGGDLDGDPFGITDYEPLFPKESADPAEYPPTIPMRLDRKAEWADVIDWVVTYIGSDVLGLLGSRRRLLADQCHSGTKHPRCLKLTELYTAAVDAPKSGQLPALHEIPRRLFKLTPDFMQPEDLDVAQRDTLHLRRYYESDKALGRLFRAIPRSITSKEHWVPPILPDATDGTDPDEVDFAIDEPITNALRTTMQSIGLPCGPPAVEDLAFAGRLMARYALELRHISLVNNLISHPGRGLSEAELVMGLIAGPSQATGGKRRDAVEKATLQAAELVRLMRRQLVEPRAVHIPPLAGPSVSLGGLEPTSLSQERPYSTADLPNKGIDGETMPPVERAGAFDDKGRRAWAAWCVATRAPVGKFGVRSFGLVALGAVLDTIEVVRKQRRDDVAHGFKRNVRDAKANMEARRSD